MDGSIYFYAPNKGAPIFFAIAFAASGLFHAYQCMSVSLLPKFSDDSIKLTLGRRYNSWRITGIYVFCSVLFTAGFIVREIGAFDYTDLIVYIVSICLIYAAP